MHHLDLSVMHLPLVMVPTLLAHLNHSFLNAIALSHSLDSIALPFVVTYSLLAINATTTLNANSAVEVLEQEFVLQLGLVVRQEYSRPLVHPVLLALTEDLVLVEYVFANLDLEELLAAKPSTVLERFHLLVNHLK